MTDTIFGEPSLVIDVPEWGSCDPEDHTSTEVPLSGTKVEQIVLWTRSYLQEIKTERAAIAGGVRAPTTPPEFNRVRGRGVTDCAGESESKKDALRDYDAMIANYEHGYFGPLGPRD